jgi:uncharacterized membrane protein
MSRGQINLVSVILTLVVLVAIVVLAPVFTRFTQMVAAEADPFSSLLLSAFVPLLVLALIISTGQSAGGSV